MIEKEVSPIEAHPKEIRKRLLLRQIYQSPRWVSKLAVVLGLIWIVTVTRGYLFEIQADRYDESALLDSFGPSMLIAEQAASTSWLEHLLAGTYEEERVLKDAILNFEAAREQGFLEERGMEMLACLYWSSGDVKRSNEIMGELDSSRLTNSGIAQDLLRGDVLDEGQWQYLQNTVDSEPRNWRVCFLTEKAITLQDYAGDRQLKSHVKERKQGLFIASAKMSIVTWIVLIVGMFFLAQIIRHRRSFVSDATPHVSRLPNLWPLPIGVIVFTLGEFTSEWMGEKLWYIVPYESSEETTLVFSLLIDAIYRTLGVSLMIWVLFGNWNYVKRTLLRPVSKLMHWVLAALAVTWVFDLILYELPVEWFPIDPTNHLRWDEYGWGGLLRGFISAVILAPICEEFIFRGLLFNVIKNKLGFHAGVWISAMLFASIHFYGMQDLIAVGFFGVVMAYLYRYTNSLIPCIVCHALFNLIITLWNWILYQSPEDLWKIG